MSRRLRFIPDRPLVEVTARTLQGRFLLRPSPGLREIFVGILARAAERYDVAVHAYVCAGNHLHALLSPADAHQLAGFMRYLLTNLSKEAGRLHAGAGRCCSCATRPSSSPRRTPHSSAACATSWPTASRSRWSPTSLNGPAPTAPPRY